MSNQSFNMEEINDITKNWPKKDPFVVPEGYFDELERDVLNKVNNNRSLNSKYSNLKSPLSLAASFAALIAISYLILFFINYNSQKSTIAYNHNQIIYSEYDFIDENSLVEYIDEKPNDFSDISDEEIINYLLDNDFDYELLADIF